VSEPPAKWVSVDPGESCGYAVWERDRKVGAGTVELWEFVFALGHELVRDEVKAFTPPSEPLTALLRGWELLVMEDWALYPWTAQALSWDRQDTVRGIGALQFIARALGRPYVLQGASIKDAAKAATAETLFDRPLHDNRHQNDATMHGVYYLAQCGKGVARAD
jgi:hypothetical protein